MSKPRLLWLTTLSPSFQHAGVVFQRELIESYSEGEVFCFALSPDQTPADPEEFAGAPIRYVRRPSERGIRRFGRAVSSMWTFLLHQYIRRVRVPALVEQAVQFGREHQVEAVWALLHRPTLTYMARQVAEQLDVDLITTVHDPPERFAEELRMDWLSRRIMLHEFRKALQDSTRCGVASEGMQEEYKERYDVDALVLIHGVDPLLRRLPAAELNSEDEFVIGFAGSLYARREWRALLSALASVDWRVDGRSVIIRVLSGRVDFQLQRAGRIEYLGWRTVEETIDVLSKVDITYLPYWFDEAHRLSVRLCFPNKLSTYVAAGRPVFYHGPQDASPTRFIQRHPVGIACHSLKDRDIVESLRGFISDPRFYASAVQESQRVFDQQLNKRVFLEQFHALIADGASPSDHSVYKSRRDNSLAAVPEPTET